MAIDYQAKESAFLTALKDDTGRDLGEWMQAIAAQDLSDRNAIIDWLRQEGFMFSKASWLERIHNNGGTPIYADGARAPGDERPVAESVPPSTTAENSASKQSVAQQAAAKPSVGLRLVVDNGAQTVPKAADPEASSNTVLKVAPSSAEEINQALMTAKAYRPLAAYVTKLITDGIADSTVVVVGKLLIFHCAGRPFCGLLLSPKGLSFGVASDPNADLPPFERISAKPAGFARFPAHISHHLRLDDARQVTDDMRGALTTAAAAALD